MSKKSGEAGPAKHSAKNRAKNRAKLEERLAKKRRKLDALATEISALERELTGETASTGPQVSPLAPERFPEMHPVPGLRLSVTAAGVRYQGRTDVMLAELVPGTVIAGTFTRSATRSAPVLGCETRLAALAEKPNGGKLGIIVNSGNANAFTGANGMEAVDAVTKAAGEAIGAPGGNVFMASTGVIGEVLAYERITAKLAELSGTLTDDALEDAARAIMTTDTFAKGSSRRVLIDGVEVTISGIAKGSGMIAPDMATMLVFIFTDCAIAQGPLQACVSALTERTFNAITVDGDTSTSDTLLVAATGQAAMKPIASRREARCKAFEGALGAVMLDLALQVVKDGEGAIKLAAITVTGAKSGPAARRIGLSIANSPLVKTAIAGEDPNWGRIVMAVGKSGEAADRDRLSIWLGDVLVAEKGWVAESYREAAGAEHMRRQELEIRVDVGVGDGRATVWTCDLTKRYIEINADYRS